MSDQRGGFLCRQCDEVKSVMWGNVCNACRAQNAHNERLAKAAEALTPLGIELERQGVSRDFAACALWQAWMELNEIRARDGVPYKHDGTRASVCEEYFSTVVENCKDAYEQLTGDKIQPWLPARLKALHFAGTTNDA